LLQIFEATYGAITSVANVATACSIIIPWVYASEDEQIPPWLNGGKVTETGTLTLAAVSSCRLRRNGNTF
jgi:hypothetical protein